MYMLLITNMLHKYPRCKYFSTLTSNIAHYYIFMHTTNIKAAHSAAAGNTYQPQIVQTEGLAGRTVPKATHRADIRT